VPPASGSVPAPVMGMVPDMVTAREGESLSVRWTCDEQERCSAGAFNRRRVEEERGQEMGRR
jgi:hypothetical protein